MAMHAAHHATRPQTLANTFQVSAEAAMALEESDVAMQERIDVILDAIDVGLAACTPHQASVWRLMTGIREDGTQTQPLRANEVAALLHIDNNSIRSRFMTAEVRVLRAMLAALSGAADVTTEPAQTAQADSDPLDADRRKERMLQAVERGLRGSSELQCQVWQSMTGVFVDGRADEPKTTSAVAQRLGYSRNSVRDMYLAVEVRVLRELLRTMLSHAAPSHSRVIMQGLTSITRHRDRQETPAL